MFLIRKQHIDKLAQHEIAMFIDEAMEFLRSIEEKRWAEVSQADLATWTAEHVACARSMGIVDETSILRYLEIASAYGDEFASRGDTLGLVVDPDVLDNWADIRRALDAHLVTSNEAAF